MNKSRNGKENREISNIFSKKNNTYSKYKETHSNHISNKQEVK